MKKLETECLHVVGILMEYGGMSPREAMGRFMRKRHITEPETVRWLWRAFNKKYRKSSTCGEKVIETQPTRVSSRSSEGRTTLTPEIRLGAYAKARQDARKLGDTNIF